jgi:hypothetical protein
MIFTKGPPPVINITYDGRTIEAVKEKRILRVHLDDKIKFNQHMLQISAHAKNAANILTQLNNLNVKSSTSSKPLADPNWNTDV